MFGNSTEATLREDIQTVQKACIGNQIIHLSHSFVNSPGHAAIVVCYATCTDEVAKELHNRLDATVAEFWAERGITKLGPIPVVGQFEIPRG
jgi:hypothetical protein